MTIRVGGHRGSGQTDHPRQIEREQRSKPAENTIPSIMKALNDGAEIIEIDAVLSADGVAMVTHSNDLLQHVLTEEARAQLDSNRRYVSEYTAEELQQFMLGPHGAGRIPRLEEVIETIAAHDSAVLNIELKGQQGTDDPNPDNLEELVKRSIADVTASDLPESRVILSSFAAEALKVAKEENPNLPRGMLFTCAADSDTGLNVCSQRPQAGIYELPTAERIRALHDELALSALHVEVTTVDEAMCRLVSETPLRAPDGKLVGITSWSLGQDSAQGWQPETTPQDQPALEEVSRLAEAYPDIAFTALTNHVPAMCRLMQPHGRQLGS